MIFSFVRYTPVVYGKHPYPIWADAIGWLLTLASNIPIVIVAVYIMCKAKGSTLRQVGFRHFLNFSSHFSAFQINFQLNKVKNIKSELMQMLAKIKILVTCSENNFRPCVKTRSQVLVILAFTFPFNRPIPNCTENQPFVTFTRFVLIRGVYPVYPVAQVVPLAKAGGVNIVSYPPSDMGCF